MYPLIRGTIGLTPRYALAPNIETVITTYCNILYMDIVDDLLHIDTIFIFNFHLMCLGVVIFQAASATANTDLPSTHPIRLGLALNFSVFYYEIMNSPERYFFVRVYMESFLEGSFNAVFPIFTGS